jgi:hypothetical protein
MASYSRPYFARRVALKTPLSFEETRRRLAGLDAGLHVDADGDRFALRRAGNLLDAYPRVTGEVAQLNEGSEVYLAVGVARGTFTLFAALTAIALFWELAALLALVLAASLAISARVTWQPYGGAIVLVAVAAATIVTLRRALRQGDDLVERVAAAVAAAPAEAEVATPSRRTF